MTKEYQKGLAEALELAYRVVEDRNRAAQGRSASREG